MLCLAQFMLILDVAVVAVAMPTVQGDLGIAPGDLMWIGTAYSLTFGGFLVVAGRLADLLGARRMVLIGLAVFALGSLGCGVAVNGWTLFVSRALQGIGAAMISPAALSLVMTSFGEGAGRAKALGMWGAVSAGGGVVGQLLGGVLTDLASWRLIFLINLPFAALVVFAVLRQVAADRPGKSQGRTDLTGAGLLTGGMVLLVAAAGQAANGFGPFVAVSALAGLAVLVAFLLVERRVANPIVPLGLFSNRHVSLGNVICFASAGATMGTVFFAALVMQQVLGASALVAGLSFAPVSAVITIVALKSGAAVARFGVKAVLLVSAALNALGMILLASAPADGSFLLNVVPGLVVFGIGGGLGFAPAMFVATTGVANEQQGLASGLLSTAQQMGGVVVLAVLNLIVVRVIVANGGPESAEAAMAGYRTGFLSALVLPALVAICVLALPRQPAPPAPVSPAPAPAGSAD
ncbi:MFS transporter [Polymorphospora rubra]|uniref:MFS transporter n=1 Tax=Polymorphospora rubra TaxID=338584 RepID=A0A810N363_9ACTN|nr:MFS transporter [Polymorphospora rubra]BCJ66649.1 MFS transporter [Polymorphospora rubra]